MENWELAYQAIATERRRRSRVKKAAKMGAVALLFTGATAVIVAAASAAIG